MGGGELHLYIDHLLRAEPLRDMQPDATGEGENLFIDDPADSVGSAGCSVFITCLATDSESSEGSCRKLHPLEAPASGSLDAAVLPQSSYNRADPCFSDALSLAASGTGIVVLRCLPVRG